MKKSSRLNTLIPEETHSEAPTPLLALVPTLRMVELSTNFGYLIEALVASVKATLIQ